MPKALCLTGMVISILVFIIFLLDLALPSLMFNRASVMLDVIFMLCAAALGYLSWSTFREQD